MKQAVAVAVAVSVFCTPLPLLAEEPDVVPMSAGQQAPWSGLLVREARFSTMLKLQLDVEELRAKLQIREQLFDSSVKVLQDQLSKAQADLNRGAQPEPWYKSRWLVWCVGLAVGMGVAIGAFYGAAQLGK